MMFKPVLKKLTPLEVTLDDALYMPNLEATLSMGRNSCEAGWGLQRPQSNLISYQRLWEYYVNMETYRDAVAYDLDLTNSLTKESTNETMH